MCSSSRRSNVVGSGNHARTFLHSSADGRLVQLPVSWYAERGGYWAMSPGYDRAAHMDFRRVVDTGCMSCHNGYPRGPVDDGIRPPLRRRGAARGHRLPALSRSGAGARRSGQARRQEGGRLAIVNREARS